MEQASHPTNTNLQSVLFLCIVSLSPHSTRHVLQSQCGIIPATPQNFKEVPREPSWGSSFTSTWGRRNGQLPSSLWKPLGGLRAPHSHETPKVLAAPSAWSPHPRFKFFGEQLGSLAARVAKHGSCALVQYVVQRPVFKGKPYGRALGPQKLEY